MAEAWRRWRFQALCKPVEPASNHRCIRPIGHIYSRGAPFHQMLHAVIVIAKAAIDVCQVEMKRRHKACHRQAFMVSAGFGFRASLRSFQCTQIPCEFMRRIVLCVGHKVSQRALMQRSRRVPDAFPNHSELFSGQRAVATLKSGDRCLYVLHDGVGGHDLIGACARRRRRTREQPTTSGDYLARTTCVAVSVGTCSTVRYPRARRSMPANRASP